MRKQTSWFVGAVVLAALVQVQCNGKPATQATPPPPAAPPAATPAAPAASSIWKDMVPPPSARTIRIKSGDEENAYAVVTAAEPLSLKVQGPCQLRVKVRLQIKKGAKSPLPYTVVTTLDDQGEKPHPFKGHASKKAVFVGAGADVVPGGSENIDMDLPAGEHTVKVALSGKDSQTLCVRHLTAPPGTATAASAKAPKKPKAPAALSPSK
jgi:hypothetical protein